MFLVMIDDENQSSPVNITASAPGAEVTIVKTAIGEGEVAEVVVIPAAGITGDTVTVTVTGSRDGLTHQQVISFEVVEGEDDRQQYAVELRDRFVSWLATSYPDLGITEKVEWTGTMVSPQWLIVAHYLFFSKDWEMHVSWHIMIPPMTGGRSI